MLSCYRTLPPFFIIAENMIHSTFPSLRHLTLKQISQPLFRNVQNNRPLTPQPGQSVGAYCTPPPPPLAASVTCQSNHQTRVQCGAGGGGGWGLSCYNGEYGPAGWRGRSKRRGTQPPTPGPLYLSVYTGAVGQADMAAGMEWATGGSDDNWLPARVGHSSLLLK